ncbi:MAG: hypothetical protein WCD08_11650 [Steroidobacteraceae bacterium]
MKRIRAALAYASVPLLAATAASAADGGVSFKSQVLPILTERCVMCHVQGAEQGALSLFPEAWSQLVGVKASESVLNRVEAGAPERSYLYLKLLGKQESAGGSGERMPFQQDPLTAEELDLFKRWIAEGAAQD